MGDGVFSFPVGRSSIFVGLVFISKSSAELFVSVLILRGLILRNFVLDSVSLASCVSDFGVD